MICKILRFPCVGLLFFLPFPFVLISHTEICIEQLVRQTQHLLLYRLAYVTFLKMPPLLAAGFNRIYDSCGDSGK